MKIYIAGKVTGESYENCRAKFNEIEKKLISEGHTVVNPLKVVRFETDWTQAMKLCIEQLIHCDAIYMLKDWRASRGAALEHFLAKELNLDVIYEVEHPDYVEKLSRRISEEIC